MASGEAFGVLSTWGLVHQPCRQDHIQREDLRSIAVRCERPVRLAPKLGDFPAFPCDAELACLLSKEIEQLGACDTLEPGIVVTLGNELSAARAIVDD